MSKEKIEQTKKAAMVFFFAVAAFLSAWYKFVSPLEKPFHKTLNQTAKGTKATIVIDPGHGGFDPGKVGANQTLEKDVNLAISEKLNQKLAASGYTVYMTRVSDEALCRGDESSKKRADMQNRVALIEEKKPDLVVSIHQNSYTTEDIKGAQVFYYGQSENGKRLADVLQEHLISEVDPQNTRVAKANESYYLLKKTPTPTVIVECGFLSNQSEADLLLTEDYQSKLAHAIYLGILSYLEEESLL
mgnify:CR=1 FL=1